MCIQWIDVHKTLECSLHMSSNYTRSFSSGLCSSILDQHYLSCPHNFSTFLVMQKSSLYWTTASFTIFSNLYFGPQVPFECARKCHLETSYFDLPYFQKVSTIISEVSNHRSSVLHWAICIFPEQQRAYFSTDYLLQRTLSTAISCLQQWKYVDCVWDLSYLVLACWNSRDILFIQYYR